MFKENNKPLSPRDVFRRADESADERFYAVPRFVAHIDDGAIRFVTEIYREYFPQNSGAILDLMSSWISHLPAEIDYSRVAAVGMNAAELAANPHLSEYVVQNLNINQILPFGDAEFDGAAICVSVQYLTDPVTVFREIGRVLKPGAPFVVTFSNRCFPTKAVYVWQLLDDEGHSELVNNYFTASGAFEGIKISRHLPPNGDPLYAVIGFNGKTGKSRLRNGANFQNHQGK